LYRVLIVSFRHRLSSIRFSMVTDFFCIVQLPVDVKHTDLFFCTVDLQICRSVHPNFDLSELKNRVINSIRKKNHQTNGVP
jgi:hypothetical protein